MTGKHKTVRRQLFPEKLWDLVNKPESGIQWSPDGKRIEVERSQLEKFIGTKFRSHNFDSFIRQLHFYGFRKCGNSYHHDKFQRGQPDALLTMKRKYSNLTLTSLTSSPCYASNSNNNFRNSNTNSSSSATSTSSSISSTSGISVSSNIAPKTIANYPALQILAQPTLPVKSREHIEPCEELTLYTLKQEKTACAVSSFVRKDLAKANRNENAITIALPEVIRDHSDNDAWPKTLVLENHLIGNQNILSAYFIYRAGELN